MGLKFSLFEVLLFIGIVQGFIISLLIWVAKTKTQDKLLLSFVLTVFNLLCLKIILFTSGLWQTNLLRYFPLPFDLAIQPLFFLYITSLTSSSFRLNKKLLVHFIPFALSLAYSLFIYIVVLPYSDLAKKDSLANHYLFNEVKETEDFLSVCSAIIYWYFSLKSVFWYRKWLYNSTSNTLFPTYQWVRNIIVLFGFFFLILTANIILDYAIDYGADHFFHWQILFVYLAILIYYLGFKGYHIASIQASGLVVDVDKQLVTSNDTESPRVGDESETPILVGPTETKKPTDMLKYKAVGETIQKLLSEEKLYLDPEFSLQALAHKLKMSPVAVSRIINAELNKNFRNLINEYRVKEVAQRLEDPASGHLSLLGIAYECGFNSEASFYRIFKSAVGLSPKEYLLRRQNN